MLVRNSYQYGFVKKNWRGKPYVQWFDGTATAVTPDVQPAYYGPIQEGYLRVPFRRR